MGFEFSPSPASSRVVWLDLNGYHCYEGFFAQSLSRYAAVLRHPPARFVSSLDALSAASMRDSLSPTGFIFHAGRSGSTILAKALARSRENMVFSEAAPHNQVWKALSGCGLPDFAFYRRLVLAMGRRRLSSYRSHFIKFTSYNILRFRFIRQVFPETPAIFLFRDPNAVLESSARTPQPWLGTDLGLGPPQPDPAGALRDHFRAVLAIRDTAFRCLDYADVRPENLPLILRFLGATQPARNELRLMQEEFKWDSKSGPVPQPFVAKESGQARSDSSLTDLYNQLKDQARSDWNTAEV